MAPIGSLWGGIFQAQTKVVRHPRGSRCSNQRILTFATDPQCCSTERPGASAPRIRIQVLEQTCRVRGKVPLWQDSRL